MIEHEYIPFDIHTQAFGRKLGSQDLDSYGVQGRGD